MRSEQMDYRVGDEVRRDWPVFSLILLMLAVGALALPHLPPRVAVHFGVDGRPNGWASPLFAVLFPPATAAGVWLLMVIMPRIDPRRRNYQSFIGFYRLLRFGVALVVLVVDLFVIWRALGHPLQARDVAVPIVSALLLFIGNALPTVRPNYFVGIRTPWTLANEEVWQRTHRFGARVLIVAALLPLCALGLSPAWTAIVLFGSLAGAAALIAAYSYCAYRRIVRE